ncbi:FecR domain-containing protein [Pseudodesulfovibrio sp. S3-i]|uniref:FecR family protein n=1 Tax=Pseudodesulfovibrio sp. S3-i TaxID=2929474 RepID=UPI001FB881CD|nr:FecR domain-containing protein [Pseudodesulfovibrio sp. S3-i]
MRKFGKFTHFLLVAAFLVCLAPVAASAAETADDFPDAIGEVVFLMGTVTAQQPDGTSRKLDLNKQVIPKDVIVTGSRSNVEIVFKDKSVFSQGADSSTSLDDYVYSDTASASKMLFKMGTGTFRYVTGQIVKQNPDAFALQTPTTTIGIRGTEVFAEVAPAQEEVGVLGMTPGHQVDVSTPQDQKTITQAGFSVKATPDGQLSNPAPTDPATRARVVKAAPQTTQGETGASTTDEKDLDRKVAAFAATVDRTKGDLGTVDDKPSYAGIHSISLQTTGQKSAESDRDKNADGGLGGGGDGGGGY